MIKPIVAGGVDFHALDDINPETGEYKDPLMKMPLRGAAFSNEVGEGLRPLIGNYATLTWVPALLYIGADIYDKYKNDQTEYSPCSKRGLKQAVFQGMASIILPLAAVKGGQGVFSLFGLLSKDKISINMQEKISSLADSFITNGNMHKYRGKDEECAKEFLDIVTNNIDYHSNKYLKVNKKENLTLYAQKTINDLIKMYNDVRSSAEEFTKSNWAKMYNKAISKGQTKNVAVKTVLSKYQASKEINGKMIKTVGGFLALFLAISPIDKFVENVLLDRLFVSKDNKKEV